MVEIEDWLQDPLRKLEIGNNGKNKLWKSFHLATRLRLDGADYFCRQALGAASMPDNWGLPCLANRLLEWYLDAFFFELMSAFDTQLQELNIVYEYDLGLNPDDVRWNDERKNKFMKNLPDYIFSHIRAKRKEDWFYKVRRYRNMATHHHRVLTDSVTVGFGEEPLAHGRYKVSIYYRDKRNEFKEEIIILKDYLINMGRYISSVWEIMKEKFDR